MIVELDAAVIPFDENERESQRVYESDIRWSGMSYYIFNVVEPHLDRLRAANLLTVGKSMIT